MAKKIKNYLQNKVSSILFVIRNFFAVAIYLTGKKPGCSISIDEVSITAGHGKLNNLGDWQYALPEKCVKKHFKGCLKWKDYLGTLKINLKTQK